MQARIPRLVLTLSGAVVSMAIFLPQPVEAKKQYLALMKSSYHVDESTKCILCHSTSGNENPGKKNLKVFGKDIQKQHNQSGLKSNEGFLAAVKAVENMDSDGDGATNIEELKLGTAPGDNSAKPDSKKLDELRKANPKK